MNERKLSREKARRRFRDRVRAALLRADEAFRGVYAEEIQGLLGLSRAEIDAITPDMTDLQTYDMLIEIVKEASRVNLAQAELKARIEDLGDVAIQIANKVPRLASIFG